MAFIRRVRTASGATAVQVAEYVGGRKQRIVAHLGSAHTEAELGILMARARELLEDSRQGELDLGVDPVVGKAPLVEPPAGGQALFAAAGGQAVGAAAGATDAVGAGRVIGTSSRVLFDALAGVYDSLGFGALGDEVFRDLVIARVVEPSSLAEAPRVLGEMGRAAASYSTLRRTLRRAAAGGYRDRIADACFAQALRGGDVSLCLYDVTTLYFEAQKEDGLRKVGYSKERRVDPQIVVGLLADRRGFPLEIGCFEGSRAEKHTLVPIIRGFQSRHGLANLVVVADAGMLSAQNLAALDDAQMRFIVGSRTTKAPIDLASHFRWHGEVFTDGQVIDTLTPKRGANRDNDQALKAEPVWNPQEHPGSWRAIWAYSAKRFVRDNKTLNTQEARARAVIDGTKTARTPRFVKNTKGAKVLDTAALARARRLAGLKGYVTNLPAGLMPAAEVIADYHDLWHIEQSFRMSKTDLAARPMFHRTTDSIEAHLTIVFTALAVARAAQARTATSIRAIVRRLRTLRSATITINGTEQTFAPHIPPDQQHILDALQR